MISSARAARTVARARLDFEDVVDPRQGRGRRHGHEGLLRLMVVAMASGKLDLRGVETLSEDLSPEVRRRLGLKWTVSDTCLYELLCMQECTGFRETLFTALRKDLDAKAIQNDLMPGGVLSIDGKGAGGGLGDRPALECGASICDAEGTPCWDLFALRASLVSSSARPVCDQEFIRGKGNEVSRFPDIFQRVAGQFPRLFRYVTVDAGMTSAANAEIVDSHDKKYVMAVKANRKRLHELARSSLAETSPTVVTQERVGGVTIRRELRRAVGLFHGAFPHASQFWSVSQQRIADDGTSVDEERFFVTSIEDDELTDEQILKLVRLHWGIENGPNWTADVILREDTQCPCTPGVAPLSWLRMLAYNLMSVFRARLPKKDNRPISWKRTAELVYQALLLFGFNVPALTPPLA